MSDKEKEETLPLALNADTTATPEPSPAPDLARVFSEQHQRVFRAALRVTGSAVDAEDVLQTVFLRLARRSSQGAGFEGLEAAYFHRAAVNAALDLLRARRRAGWVPLEEAGEAEAADSDQSGGPEQRERARDLRRGLRRALATLSPRSAEIFALRYFEGLGNREIAAAMGTSHGVVAVLLHRSRNRLRRELAAFLGEPS